MSRLNGEQLYEIIGHLPDELVTEAAEELGLLSEPVPMADSQLRKRGENAFARFFGSGWGVAVICAVVSLSVLSGIIWAGQRPPAGGPGGTETETTDYAGENQDEVTVRHGDTVICPQRFFLWSMEGNIAADGLGFAGEVAVYHNNQPSLPKVIYAKDGSVSPCELTLAKGYSLDYVEVYGADMERVSTPAYDGDFSYVSLLQFLPAGRYYVSLQIRHKSSGYDYAFELEVTDAAASDIISEEQAMKLASDYWGIQTGDVNPDNGFEFRIESRESAVTSRGEEVYVILLRWLVAPFGHWSTVDTVWVNRETGEIIIPYGNIATETEAHVHAFGEWSIVPEPTCPAVFPPSE